MNDKILKYMIKVGFNPSEAEKMILKYYDYVNRVYPESSVKEKVNIIASLHD
jgi:hypothetical protein